MKNPLLLLLLCFCFSYCGKKDSDYIDPRGTAYAGSQSCAVCHAGVHSSTMAAAHQNATRMATPETVWGSFQNGQNTFVYGNKVKVAMEKRGDSMYQVVYENGKEQKAYPFGIVFGSVNAQTAVYWHHGKTYQMPVSYYQSTKSWGSSPGYPKDYPYFEKHIEKECYACHSSNIESGSIDPKFAAFEETIDPKNIVYGIDCERCHGPAKKHVAHHLKFPELKTGHDIVSYKALNNQQKLDACSICHSGIDGFKIKSRFEFKPGDNLFDFYRNVQVSSNQGKFDVHGNQAGLFTQSKCFTQSRDLNCISCHNPNEKGMPNLVSQSKNCIGCHKSPLHAAPTLQAITDKKLQQNCIDCHMPKQASGAISFYVSQNPNLQQYLLRNHKIAVYPLK